MAKTSQTLFCHPCPMAETSLQLQSERIALLRELSEEQVPPLEKIPSIYVLVSTRHRISVVRKMNSPSRETDGNKNLKKAHLFNSINRTIHDMGALLMVTTYNSSHKKIAAIESCFKNAPWFF